MACCRGGKSGTALEIYAKTLPGDTGAAMLFPMYTVAVELLLQMTKVQPHEELKAQGQLTVFEKDATKKAAFASHQWVSKHHPDPEFRQMKVLQDVLMRLLDGSTHVPLDWVTETYVLRARPLPSRDFQTCSLYIWYDYFSCPQLEQRRTFGADESDGSQQAKAITSIPAYVAQCDFFFVLCPVIECPETVLSGRTWAQRGWCRVERAARELSANSTWIVVQGKPRGEVVGSGLSFLMGPVGEGDFTKEEDRKKLAPVMRQIVMRKLMNCLRAGDLPGFRRHLNLQSVHLRGLDIEPILGVLPLDTEQAATNFLHQNGFRKASESDVAGWCPLHYAALSGNTEVIRGLLQQRASVNRRTSRDDPCLGLLPWMSALDIAAFYRQNDAVQLLITVRAHLEGGIAPAVTTAAISDNAEGVRLLCAAGGTPLSRTLLGDTAFPIAAVYSLASFEVMLQQVQPDPREVSYSLFAGVISYVCSAELVQRLLSLRGDVDFQFDQRLVWKRFRLYRAAKGLQYQFGGVTTARFQAYHMPGSTPLMMAIMSAQYEAAAALIAAGADLQRKNSRGWTAADFAHGRSMPQFLQSGLQGDRVACQEVTTLGLKDGMIEVCL